MKQLKHTPITMEETFQMREVINDQTVQQIANDIHGVWPEFDRSGFTATLTPIPPELGVIDRAKWVKDQLYHFLPKDYPTAVHIMLDSFGSELESADELGFSVFYYLPHGDYVATYGLAPEHFELSMKALYEITKRFTSEWPIRSFLEKHQERTLQTLAKWVKDKNAHVRRLVSEGTRPRLPWAGRLKAFQKDPTPVLELIAQLKTDPELYVRRSVANNLNDIAKDHPDLVVKTLKEWNKIDNEDTKWLIRHALRSLIKAGHVGALELLGFPKNVKVKVHDFKLSAEQVKMGDQIEFQFKVTSEENEACKLMIDYTVFFMKANGQLAPKVFKLSQKEIAPGETIELSKKQSFKPISTRKYYPGRHEIGLQINGSDFGKKAFELL